MKWSWKRSFLLLALLFTLGLLTLSVHAADVHQVTTEAEFEQALGEPSPVNIVLMNDLTLTKTYTITDKEVEIGGAHTITLAPTLRRVFVVKDQGSLTLKELTFDLQQKEVCVIDNSATASFDSGVIKNGKAGSGSGILYCHGATAKLELNDGTLTDHAIGNGFSGVVYATQEGEFVMNGGIITKTTVTNQFAGPVSIYNAKMTMNDGLITQNTTNSVQSGSGIMLSAMEQDATAATGKYSELIMNGGTISGNQGWRGGGVHIMGGNASGYNDFFSSAKFIMNDGTISNNQVSPIASLESGGGGVYIEYGGEMVMNGGAIENNTANTGSGGGIACYDAFVSFFGKRPYDQATGGYNGRQYSDWDTFFKAGFEMNGGTIRGNAATSNSSTGDNGCGGGIYIASNNVSLHQGIIENNTASKQGGGVYVGSVPYTLHLYDALISENTASYIGGGVWCCPTGTIENAITNGGAVIGNQAHDAGDDIVTIHNATNSTATVATRILGGGRVDWYVDGGVTDAGNLGGVDASVPRYISPQASARYTPIDRDTDLLSLKAVVPDGAAEQAASVAKVFIRGNSSMRGGGLGTNGTIVLGKPYESPIEIRVQKKFENPNGVRPEPPRPTQITVNLLANDHVIDSTTVSAATGWKATFAKLPYQADITYRVEEVPVPGWIASYDGQQDHLGNYDFTVTNQARKPAVIQLQGKKYLNGEVPSEAYTFELYDASGKRLQTVENQGETFAFQPLTHSAPGTYHYYIVEQKGSIVWIDYDPVRYDVTVTVGDDLSATTQITRDGTPADEIVFYNQTNDLYPPGTGTETGDSGAGILPFLLISSLLGLAIAARYRIGRHATNDSI